MKIVTLAAIAAALSLGAAHAQVAKKYVTPEGKTVYSDTPIPGAREVGEVAAPPPVDPGLKGQSEAAARREASEAQKLDRRAGEERAREARIETAEAALAKAERELKDGIEPRPGERTGLVGGNSRLNDAYYARQDANQAKVDAARRELEAARTAR